MEMNEPCNHIDPTELIHGYILRATRKEAIKITPETAADQIPNAIKFVIAINIL
jgi:hypothetical protein